MEKHILAIDVGRDAGASPAADAGVRRGLKPQPIRIPGFTPFWLPESMSVEDAR